MICEIVENEASGKKFSYCRTHKVESKDCPKLSASYPATYTASMAIDALEKSGKRTLGKTLERVLVSNVTGFFIVRVSSGYCYYKALNGDLMESPNATVPFASGVSWVCPGQSGVLEGYINDPLSWKVYPYNTTGTGINYGP